MMMGGGYVDRESLLVKCLRLLIRSLVRNAEKCGVWVVGGGGFFHSDQLIPRLLMMMKVAGTASFLACAKLDDHTSNSSGKLSFLSFCQGHFCSNSTGYLAQAKNEAVPASSDQGFGYKVLTGIVGKLVQQKFGK